MSGRLVGPSNGLRALLSGPAFQWALAVTAPIAVALLLIPGRNHLDSADDALVLVVVTVAIASGGSRIRAFAAAIVRLAADPAYSDALGSAARDYVERNYSWDQAAERLERVYARVVPPALPVAG